MAEAAHGVVIPRGVLIAAAAAVLLALLAATVGRVVGPEQTTGPSHVIAVRELRFEDRLDGAVYIRDAADGSLIDIAQPGTNGFLRASLRGLARERRAQGVGAEVPFRLTHWADGRLTLDDPATGRHLEMEAFGHSNAEVFAHLLVAKGTAQ
jgi:putative photosynthetic complex assembly protein